MRLLKGVLICSFILIISVPSVLSENRTCLYLFYGATCPHCAQERPFLRQLKEKYPELEIHEFEVYYNKENREFWKTISDKYQTEPSGVPMTFIGDMVFIGYSKGDTEIYDKRYKAYIGYSGFIEKTVKRYIESGGIDCPDKLEEINVVQPNGSFSNSAPVSSPYRVSYLYIIFVVLVIVGIFIVMSKFRIRIKIGGDDK